jgi:ubiquitin-conjugating enzyme E2 variant
MGADCAVTPALPQHPQVSALSRGLERGALIAAPALVLMLVAMRGAAPQPLDGVTLLLVVLGILAADFVSGLVHWAADTWGSKDWPLIGERLIEPFRVHHVNPRDICRRDMIDLNGDIALLSLPLLVWALHLPLADSRHAVEFVAAFVAFTLPTNLIHRWAHAGRDAPWLARQLQRSGLILSPRRHHPHHRSPFDRDYCIVNGWCNPLLRATRFWRGAERLVSKLSGAVPRADDAAVVAATFARTR